MFLVAAATLTATACSDDGDGGSDQSAAIVRVGDVEISQARYDRVLSRVAAGYAKARTYPGRRYYVPPDYTLCVRNRRERGSVPKDWPASRVKVQCRHNHQRLRVSILTSLIEDKWLEQAGAVQGLEPPSDETARITEFPTDLAQAAVDRADTTITDVEVARYYRRHRDLLRRPEERDWRAVLSDTAARAASARRALEQGVGWERVASRYGSPAAGGAPLESVATPEGNERSLSQAIYAADKGQLVGPVKTTAGYYVLTVERITPPRQYSLEQSRTAIVPVLETSRKEQAQIDYWSTVRRAARKRTVCLGELKVPSCSNGPRRGFDADGPFAHTDPRPVLPPPKSLPDEGDADQGSTEAPALQ